MEISTEDFRHYMDSLRTEVHDLSKQFNDWKVDLGERIAILEVHDADISGNHQPGRMKLVEEAVVAMGNRFATIAGALAILGMLAALVGWFFPRH